jgi:hypothetical protein
VKKDGSLPSMTIYIGVKGEIFSRRKSCSRNFCKIPREKLRNKHLTSEILIWDKRH